MKDTLFAGIDAMNMAFTTVVIGTIRNLNAVTKKKIALVGIVNAIRGTLRRSVKKTIKKKKKN